MEWLDQIWAQLADYISIPYLLIFILLSYFIKKYFGQFLQKITKFTWLPVYTVLILATLVAVPFLIWSEISWVEILFSYALGTTLHELIFFWLEKLWKKFKK